MKVGGEKDDVWPNKHIKVGKTSSGKDAASVGSSLLYPSQSSTMMMEPREDAKASNQFNLSGSGPKKKFAESQVLLDRASSAKASNGVTSVSLADTRDLEKQKTGGLLAKSVHSKLKDPSGSSAVLHHKHHDRSALAPSKSQSGRNAMELEELNRREKHGVNQVPDLNMPGNRQMETSVSSLFLLFPTSSGCW